MADALKDAAELGAVEPQEGAAQPELNDDQRLAENRRKFFAELKEKHSDAPTEETVETWKAQNGRVKVVMFDEDECYFFRALKGTEYKGMVQQAIAGTKEPDAQNELLKDKIVCGAVLWPKINATETGALYAGTKDSLYTMIMQASNFVTPDEASVMVQSL